MAEEQELYNLAHGKTRIPRCLPVPDIRQFQHEIVMKNPFRKFRMENSRTREVHNFLGTLASRTERRISRERSINDVSIRVRPSKFFQLQMLTEWAKQIPIDGLLPRWEKNILDLVPESSKSRNPEILSQIIEEAKAMYLEEMREFGMRMLLAPSYETECRSMCEERSFKNKGRTEHRGQFLKNRKLIAARYFLSHGLMRNIVDKSCYRLPKIITDFGRYRDLGLLKITEFQDILAKDLRKGALIITNQYYGDVARLISQPKALQKISAKKLPEFMRCATSLFVQQILNTMMYTIEHMIKILGDPQRCPQIKFELVCDSNELLIEPSVKRLCSIYHKIIDDVANIAQELLPLEVWLNVKTKQEYIKVKLPDWFIGRSHDELQKVLDDTFQPLNDYFNTVFGTFGTVCASKTRANIVELVSERWNFVDYCTQVEKFNGFVKRANSMVANEYYAVGKLGQNEAKTVLKGHALEIVSIIVEELVAQHQKFNLSICSEFEDLKSRALNVPNSTKDLFDLGEYMAYASETLVKELTKKIQKSINMLGSLLQITSLTDEHIELNRRTINWLALIEPVFEQNNALSEEMKVELEDELQRRLNVLNGEIDEIFPKLVVLDNMDDVKRIREYMEDLRVLVRGMDQLDAQIQWINLEEKLFRFPETPFPKIVEIKEMIMPFYALIHLVYQWQRDNAVWLDGPFEYLDATVIDKKTMDYFEEFTQISKTFKTRIKMDIASNKPYRFSGIVDDPDPMQQPAPLKLCWQVLKDVTQFKQYVPLAICMCNPALVKRHWDEMSAIAGIDLLPNAGTTLRKIIAFDLMDNIEKYEVISIGANKELALQQQLTQMSKEWDPVTFTTIAIKNSGVRMLTELDAVEALLEEHLVRIQEMRGSYFFTSVKSMIMEFYDFLLRVQKIISQWTKLQDQWQHMLSIFSNKATAAQLAEEKTLFLSVDSTLKHTMELVSRDPSVRRIIGSTELLEVLQKANDRMERINEGVHNYLDRKRSNFPRFFFLPDTDMMAMLFEMEDPSNVQQILQKMFEGIARLGVDSNSTLYSVIADDEEELLLQRAISTSANSACVDKWLVQIEREIVSVLQHAIHECYEHYEEDSISKLISDWPGMVIICVSQIYWTMEVQNCLVSYESSSFEDYLKKLSKKLTLMIDELKSPMTKRERSILSAMIITSVHDEDVVEMLIEKNVTRETDFYWHAQMRYYNHNNVVEVRLISASVKYACEYIGNQPRLVITPLTDRCYRTLMEAYHHHMYGAPAGPSGSGKTETIKNLANAIAVQCKVFNCSNSLDYQYMSKIFKGISSCGAWACFKDLDRIDVQVLSVVAQQIFSISQAVRSNAKKFILEGSEVALNPAVFICMTLNHDHSVRSDLPNNLRVLFRGVALVVPDYIRISEVLLFAAGFSRAEILAVKISTVYKLCSEQLSSESHYDYRLRTVIAVVKTAASLKIHYPDEDEVVLLLRSLIDVNVPKFLERDIPIFKGIIKDVFPEVVLPPPNYNELLEALGDVCMKRNLQPHDVFKLKVIQTFEMMHLRHAFMLVGDPFGGKTSVLHSLAESLTLLHELGKTEIGISTKFETINPSALSRNQFLGLVDPTTSKWMDGICSVVFRSFSRDETAGRKWLIFDGPLDSTWIEDLNTVLDDNKTLYLSSGEKITMSNSMSLIFETMDLIHASPATISRCGMIYIEPKCAGWGSIVKSQMLKCSWYAGHEDVLYSLFDWLIDPCLKFIRERCILSVKSGQIHQVVSTFNLFEMYLNDAVEERTGNDKDCFLHWAEASMVLSMVWGAAGNLDHDSRRKFDEFYVSLLTGTNSQFAVPQTIRQLDISLPSEGLIQDNYYIFKGKGVWKYWNDALKNEKLVETTSIRQMFVPTFETLKYMNLFRRHIKHRKQFLLCGDTATGKSFLISDLMRSKIPEEEYLANFFTFTAKTTASQAQKIFLSKLCKRKRGHYGPPEGKFGVTFVDDVNMPDKEISGAQPALELLRQKFDHNHWYDLTTAEKVSVYDVMFVSALTLGGNLADPCPRFLRHFNLYTISVPSKDSIFRIFSNVLLISLKRNSFNADVLSNVNSIVNATIDVYMSVKTKLRPIPTRFHYLFNIRDISRVMTGCAQIHKDSVESKIMFIRLWVHEALRVFGDRIADQDDKQWLFQQIKDSVKTFFKDTFEAAFDHLPKFEEDQITQESLRDLMFGNFMDIDADSENRRYEEIPTLESFKNKALHYLDEYNNTHVAKMDIVLFRNALEHLARICRILATPGGSLLIICVGGSGRRSLTRLAATMAKQDLFEPAVGTNYDFQAWRKDVKKAMSISGGEGKDLVFFFTDRQMKEGFLHDIDCLLNSGEIPDLFSVDEIQDIIQMVRLPAQGGNRNLELSIASVLDYFVLRCKEKLHFILCFSPIDDTLKSHMRSFPSLLNCCTMDRLASWPENALDQVAMKWMKIVNIEEDTKAVSVDACKFFHNSATTISQKYTEETRRRTYVTSSAFLQMVRLYADLMLLKQEEITMARNRYLGGLEKLQFAAQQVAKMKNTLTALRPQLELSAAQTVATMREIESENISVEKATVLVKKDEEVANRKAEIASALKTECEADLAVAIPILEEAVAALNTLKPTDITLVKAMKNPPDTVKLVMAAVCVMLNVHPDRIIDPATGKKITDYWGPSKRVLGDMNFLQNLKDYDKDCIPMNVMQVIKKTYMTDNSFMPNIVAKASSAAEGLCKWVRAMVSYDEIAKVVAPKKEKLAAAQKECNETEAFLNEKRKILAALNKKLAALNDTLQATLAEKLQLENQVKYCTSKLVKAENLISSLGGEKSRWMRCAENLQRAYDNLAGDILLSCGMIAYLGPFPSLLRVNTLEKWIPYVKALNIPCSVDYDFIKVLGSGIKISLWNIYGLSKDRLSTENAVIMDNSKSWSLFIDPQSQANKWIREMEKCNDLRIIKFSDASYMEVLVQSIEHGKPVLLENIGEILETALDPILSRNVYKVDENWHLNIHDKTVKYCRDFRFYITTKVPNPQYSPDIFNKVKVINFELAGEALENQLLNIVVTKEKPDLQEKFENLLIQSAANKKALKQEEDNILSTLSTSSTNIIEDENAIKMLDSSKNLSEDIIRRQKCTKVTEQEIDDLRQIYKPFAQHSAALYGTLIELPNLNPMYQFSLTWFRNLFISSIETSNRSVVLKRRLDFLKNAFTHNLYSSVCRSLFEKDKLLYTFVLTTKMLLYNNQITQEEVNFFAADGVRVHDSEPNPAATWLSEKSWNEIRRVAVTLPSFKDFESSFRSNNSAWQRYFKLTNPQDSPIPQPWEDQLTEFQKVIVMKIIRPDKVTNKIAQFIENGMGKTFVNAPTFNISKSFAESSCLVPLIFILSTDSDPMSTLLKFAHEMGYSSKFVALSMGQGQDHIAKTLIERGQKEGWWIFLQNCHLAHSWMPQLEKICETVDVSNTFLGFRLWLSSLPSDHFSITVLQTAVKMTNDSPEGLRQSLMRSYRTEPVKDREFFESCPGKDKVFSKLLYGLCFFHAIVRERRYFGPQGWNTPYDFDQSDFQISVQQLKFFINEYEDTPFEALRYLVGECNYGGKIMDDMDRRCLITIITDYCCPKIISDPSYSFAFSPEYSLPKRCDFRDYVRHIENIPLHQPPEVFGLHANTGILRELNAVRGFLKSLAQLERTVSSCDEETKQQIILTTKEEICRRLPELFDMEEVEGRYPFSYENSMNAILVREIEGHNRLLEEIKTSLALLDESLQGLADRTTNVEVLSEYLFIQEIPSSWKNICAFTSIKSLSGFIEDLLERVAFFRKWFDEGPPNVFWLPGFSFCSAFLSAARQNFSRKSKVSIDRVDFDFDVLSTRDPTPLASPAVDGIYVYGLFLSGARWNAEEMMLAECTPGIFWDLMPVVWFKFKERTLMTVEQRYECPLYTTASRQGKFNSLGRCSNLILTLFLNTDKPSHHWMKRGLALLCQVDDSNG